MKNDAIIVALPDARQPAGTLSFFNKEGGLMAWCIIGSPEAGAAMDGDPAIVRINPIDLADYLAFEKRQGMN